MSRHTQDKQYQYSEFSQKSLPVCIYNLQFQLPRSFGELTVMSVGNTSVQPVYANMSNTWVHIQWKLSNLDTLGTISGVHFMEVSWFQGLVNMQMQHWDHNNCPEYGGVRGPD